jgi:phytoene synthase
VRQQDRDRFFLSLTAEPKRRPALWALFAFNHEIAKTREVVTETQLGLIRLQWWRDNIAALYQGKEPFGNPVLIEMGAAIRTHDLPQADFDALLYAREFDLEGVTPPDMKGLENYADFTTTPLNRLVLKILGREVSEKTLRDVSTGYGLVGITRAAPYHAAHGLVLIPPDLPLADIVARAEELLIDVPNEVKFLKFTAALTRHYLQKLRRNGYNPADPQMKILPIYLIFKALMGIL